MKNFYRSDCSLRNNDHSSFNRKFGFKYIILTKSQKIAKFATMTVL